MNMAMLTPAAAKQQAVILRIEARKIMRGSGGAASPDQISRYRNLSRQAEALEEASRQLREGTATAAAPVAPQEKAAKPVVRRISVEEAARMNSDGVPFAELAPLMGCCDEHAAGVKVRQYRAAIAEGMPPPGDGERIRKIDMSRLLELEASGAGRAAIAAELRVTISSVARAQRRLRAGRA